MKILISKRNKEVIVNHLNLELKRLGFEIKEEEFDWQTLSLYKPTETFFFVEKFLGEKQEDFSLYIKLRKEPHTRWYAEITFPPIEVGGVSLFGGKTIITLPSGIRVLYYFYDEGSRCSTPYETVRYGTVYPISDFPSNPSLLCLVKREWGGGPESLIKREAFLIVESF